MAVTSSQASPHLYLVSLSQNLSSTNTRVHTLSIKHK